MVWKMVLTIQRARVIHHLLQKYSAHTKPCNTQTSAYSSRAYSSSSGRSVRVGKGIIGSDLFSDPEIPPPNEPSPPNVTKAKDDDDGPPYDDGRGNEDKREFKLDLPDTGEIRMPVSGKKFRLLDPVKKAKTPRISRFMQEKDEDDVVFSQDPKKHRSTRYFQKERRDQEEDESYNADRFSELNISPLTLKALQDLGYEKMTSMQRKTLPVIFKGKDVMIQAKSGSDKSLAFMLPAIETILKYPMTTRSHRKTPIIALIICPTRELAIQVAAEANALLKYHADIGVQYLLRGKAWKDERKILKLKPCQILVGTPNRILLHLYRSPAFPLQLGRLQLLVLDEFDRVLARGSQKIIEKIVSFLPKYRQTVLFSAAVSDEVHHVCQFALRRDHDFLNTIAEETEEAVTKSFHMAIVTSQENHFHILSILLHQHFLENPDYKVIVFCTAEAVARLVHYFLAELKFNVKELHSAMPHIFRTELHKSICISKRLILVTADLAVRAADYPGVTLIVQVGVPQDRQQYNTRFDRSKCKEKAVQGYLLLAPWEEFFLFNLKDLPIKRVSVPDVDHETHLMVQRALSYVGVRVKINAYRGWIEYYNSIINVGGNKERLVQLANEFSRTIGMAKQPYMPRRRIRHLKLSNIPGLRLPPLYV